MRSSKRIPGTTIKSRVLALLEDGKVLTATEAAHQTGSRWSTTSSLLYRLMQDGVVDRIPNFGPLKGYGYFLRKHAKKIGPVGLLFASGDQEVRVCRWCHEEFLANGKSGSTVCVWCANGG